MGGTPFHIAAPTRAPRKPVDDSYTQDVRTRGLAAIEERRTAARFGRTNADEGLGFTFDTGQPANPDSDFYDQWLKQTTPAGYDVQVGQMMGGPYNGFQTQGMLQAAIRGRAESLRGNDAAAFDALDQMASQGLDRLQQDYTTNYDQAKTSAERIASQDRPPILAQFGGAPRPGTATHRIPTTPSTSPANPLGGTPFAPPGALPSSPATPDSTVLQRMAEDESGRRAGAEEKSRKRALVEADWAVLAPSREYKEVLNGWLADESAPLIDQVAFADRGRSTPIRHYANQAGAEYGVDPNVIGGWYPDDSAIGDYRDQRDLESIEQFGMPFGDQQQALADMERQSAAAQGDQAAIREQQLDDAVFSVTGQGATKLATNAGLSSPEQLAEYVFSDAFMAYNDEIVAARETGDTATLAETVTSVLNQAAMDDLTMFAIFEALYRDYVPDDYSLYDEV